MLMEIPNIFGFLSRHKGTCSLAEELKTDYRRKASELRFSLSDKNVAEKSREFFGLVHSSFSRLLGITQATTFSEVKRTVRDADHIDDGYKIALLSFLDEIEHLEYDFPEFVSEAELEIAKEKDAAMHYLSYLKKKAGGNARKKLAELDRILLEDEPVTAKAILENYIGKFEELLEGFKV